ncbi:MAG TPA: VWA domain-containing protein, partial [Pyrinomonadaceae bacterium]
MLSHKRFAAAVVLALAAAVGFGGGGASARRQQSQPQQPAPRQTPPPAAQRPDVPLDDDDVERVETDLTNVLFTAVDKNKRFVTSLKQEDIRLLEDGVEQKVFTFQRETDRPLSLAILIDVSASQERTLPEEKSAAQRFVDTVIRARKDEVAVLTFTGDATLELGLTGSATRVRRAIDNVEFTPPSGYVGGGVTVG